jgi:translocation and assembly module TamB
VDMYGLVADVEGGVVLTQTGSSQRRAVGNLNLVNGTFSRYGQSFVVERGRLIFSGPLNNPLVDVVSSRTINEAARVVKVTLVLSGPANNIKSTITSEPPMSSANALSYLVLGRPLDSASAAEGRSLSSAALSLGLKQAMPITEEIKSALGLTELGVVGNGADSTSVIAGKRINPDLYVEYSYDVFSRIGGILFSYQLTSKLSVETRTGESKSMTLVYTFE